MSIRVHRKPFPAIKLLAYPRGLSSSRKIQFFDISCGLFMPLHFTIGCYNRHWISRRRQSFQFSGIKSFLLIMCIEAPESTTHSLSSGLRVDGAGKHLFLMVRRMLLFFLLLFLTHFGQFPRCFAGTLLLPLRLFLRPILKFWSVGITLVRSTWANHTERGILVLNVSMTYHGLSESNSSDWLPYV